MVRDGSTRSVSHNAPANSQHKRPASASIHHHIAVGRAWRCTILYSCLRKESEEERSWNLNFNEYRDRRCGVALFSINLVMSIIFSSKETNMISMSDMPFPLSACKIREMSCEWIRFYHTMSVRASDVTSAHYHVAWPRFFAVPMPPMPLCIL